MFKVMIQTVGIVSLSTACFAAEIPDLSSFGLGGTPCIEFPAVSQAGQIGGELKFLGGQQCMDLTNPAAGMEGNINLEFVNYASSMMFSANGRFSVSFKINNLSNPTQMSLGYSGRPLQYMVSGNEYAVTYNDLSFSVSLNAQNQFVVENYSGGVTVDGNFIPASEALYDFVNVLQ